MRTLTGEYPYQKFGVGTSDLTFIPFPLMEKTFARPDDELMLLLISAHEALIAKDSGKVREFAFSENTLLVYDYYKANLACEIPEAAKNLNLSFNTVSKAVELLQKKKILELVNQQVRHRKFIYHKAADLFV